MESITDADYTHVKRVEIWNKRDLRKYHDLYVQNDTLMLADVFNNIRNMCLEIDEINPAYFLSTWRLERQPALKNTKVKLDLLTDIEMLFLPEEVEYVMLFIHMWMVIILTKKDENSKRWKTYS